MQTEEHPAVYLARQPIYDRRLKVFGYELLYRSANVETAGTVTREQSASTIVRALSDIGLERLVQNVPAFINVPAFLLDDPALELLPPDRVIFEILEETKATPEALKAAANLAEKGYRLALDDFVLGSDQEAFIPSCKIVKVDLLSNKRHNLPTCVQLLKKNKVRALAEKVETMEAYARCQALGFDYFQGYFFARPDMVSARGVPPSKSVVIQLLTRLQDPDVSISELEDIVSADVGITFRLFKLVNSACVSLNATVDSVRGALMVLGLERVVSLISLLALSGAHDKPNELMVTAMVRAKMCEGVAHALGLRNPHQHFTVGLLSVLEAMFDVPIATLLEHLPLADDLRDALIDPASTNPLAETLRIVLRFESGKWEELDQIMDKAQEISDSYVDAVRWADETKTILAAA